MADLLARRRLRTIRLQTGRSPLSQRLRRQMGGSTVSTEEVLVVGMLVTQWDIIRDISLLHRNVSGPLESQLEILTIMALGAKEYGLANRVHKSLLRLAKGKGVDVAKQAARVEAKLAPKGELPASQRAWRMGIGLAYMEAHTLARIASSYYRGSVSIEAEQVAHLHELSQGEKVDLVEVLVAVAWADGRLDPRERVLIERQVELAELPKETAQRLLAHLDQPPAPEELLLKPLDVGARRFVLEQGVLLSLVDDEQDPSERELLRHIARRLGGEEQELEEIMVEVMAFYMTHRDLIHELGSVGQEMGLLRSLVLERARLAITTNLNRIVQEVRETGEVARLLTAASVRPLSAEEAEKVKNQLLDICKTIPALAIFALPGGALLLPILIKALPFNILPTAFQASDTSSDLGSG